MQSALTCLSLAVLSVAAAAQAPSVPRPTLDTPDGTSRRLAEDPRVMLDYAQFDPLTSTPAVPESLRAGPDVRLFIVQFHGTPNDADRRAVAAKGGVIKGYLPHDCHLVYLPQGPAQVTELAAVRWVGAYEPTYRIEPFLLNEHLAGKAVPVRQYNMVMADKRRDKKALEAKITALGGTVTDRHLEGLLFTAKLTGAQMLQAARLDEVVWIDRWGPHEKDMNNARAQGGANFLENTAGYSGAGVRGHVFEGVESDHSCFDTDLVNVLSGGEADRHGHCTAAIIFGNGSNSSTARGLAPDARGYFTNNDTMTSSRNATINNVVNTRNCMFTTASWGGSLTGNYTSVSSDADDIVFDHGIPWTQSMSNWGSNTQVRPEAWAKNVISVGAVYHGNNSAVGDDSWAWPGPGPRPFAADASIGPAADTRNKPDLCAYYDNIFTSDISAGTTNWAGAVSPNLGGYSTPGLTTATFGGTSGATPIVAGFNALAIEMYTDHIFGNRPRVLGGSRFENRPYAMTLKALMIAGARPYTPTATNNRREHVGWGFPNVGDLYSNRHKMAIIPETLSIEQGETFTFEFDVLPGEDTLKFVMAYLDPAGNPAASFDRVNDLDLRAISPSGLIYWGNNGLDGAGQSNTSTPWGFRDTRDTVEVVMPPIEAGRWTVAISAPTLTTDANLATGATDATFALVVNGGVRVFGAGCARRIPDRGATSDNGNYFPFGGYNPRTLETTFTANSGGGTGGAVYFDVTVNSPMFVHSLRLNTTKAIGEGLHCDVYRTSSGQSYAGNETNISAWLPRTAGRGVSAGGNSESIIELSEPMYLAAGTYGFAIAAMDFNHRYTIGTGSNESYSNADLTLDLGTATNVPFTGTVFSPRVANVQLDYRLRTDSATNMRYQMILRRDQLGAAGEITGLAFAGQSTGRHWASSILVRMAHVPLGHTLSSTFTNNLPSPTTVLSANNYSWQYLNNNWAEIGLQNGFNYNGNSDVVIEFILRGNVMTTTGSSDAPFHRNNNGERVYATGWPLFAPSTGTTSDNGALRVRATFGCARANEYGSSCGRLDATHIGEGSRGDDFYFVVTDAIPSSLAFIGLGIEDLAPSSFPLDSLGWTNCNAYSATQVIETRTTTSTGISTSFCRSPTTPRCKARRCSASGSSSTARSLATSPSRR